MKPVGWRNEPARHALASRGIESTNIQIKRLIPSHDLTDVQLVQRIKAKYPHEDKQSLYSRYVQERHLNPDIDAKKFYDIFDRVNPNIHVEHHHLDFKPTHRDKNTGELVMIQMRDGGGYDLIFEDGSTGSNPPFMKVKDYYNVLE